MPIMQSYQAHTWSDKELITAKKMNDIENAIATINNNAIQKPSDVFTTGLKIGGDGSVNSNKESVLLTVYGNSDNARIEIISTDTSNWAGENRLFFRERATTGSGYESYYLPTIDADLSSAKTYEILTTKKSGLKRHHDFNDSSINTGVVTPFGPWTVEESGIYLLIGTACFSANATGLRQIGISLASDSVNLDRYAVNRVNAVATANTKTTIQVTCAATLTAGDTVYLQLRQDSGSTLNVTYPGIQSLRIV